MLTDHPLLLAAALGYALRWMHDAGARWFLARRFRAELDRLLAEPLPMGPETPDLCPMAGTPLPRLELDAEGLSPTSRELLAAIDDVLYDHEHTRAILAEALGEPDAQGPLADLAARAVLHWDHGLAPAVPPPSPATAEAP